MKKVLISVMLLAAILLITACGEVSPNPKGCEHKESGWITTLAPTCLDDGSRYKKCTVCSAIVITESIPIDPDNHISTYTEKENEVSASICIDGHYDIVKYCSGCGDAVSVETVTVPAPHKYSGGSCVFCGKAK